MYKTTICILISLFISYGMSSQILGQDKNGFSSLVQVSSTFNLDVTSNVATLNYYQESWLTKFPKHATYMSEERSRINSNSLADYATKLRVSWELQEDYYQKSRLIYGIDMKGSSSNGIALLINNEQLVTQASISGLLGYGWQKRVYNYNFLNEYAKMTYDSSSKASEDKKVSAIENEAQKLVGQKIIPPQKLNDLLYFRRDMSRKAKTESIEKLILSIKEFRGFTDPVKLKQSFDSRFKLLKTMETQASIIKNTYVPAYNLAKASGNVQQIYVALKNLKIGVTAYEMSLKNKLVKSLVPKLTNLEHKNIVKWQQVLTNLAEAKESTGYDLYELNQLTTVAIDLDPLIAAYEDYLVFLRKDSVSENDLAKAKGSTYSIQRNLIYFKVGFTGTSFKYDFANESTSISERFKTREFQGYRLEVGYTGQSKRYNFFGLNAAMNRSSNAEMLTATTYKFEETDISVTPNITVSTELKALSGPFDRFLKYDLSFDYVRLIPFHDKNASEAEKAKSKLLLSINPYVRHSFYDESETLKPHTSLGLGVYSFNKKNGSISGGLFIQADDVFNINTNSPIPFTEQISVGIVVKAAIKSFNPTK